MTSFIDKSEEEVKQWIEDAVKDAVESALDTAIEDIEQAFEEKLLQIIGQPNVTLLSDLMGHTDQVGQSINNGIVGLGSTLNIINSAFTSLTGMLKNLPVIGGAL